MRGWKASEIGILLIRLLVVFHYGNSERGHTVYNIGDKEFYLVSFLTKSKTDLPETPKMPAKNYFADIMGTNLEFALETYDWKDWHPMTDNGLTVAGFWDSRGHKPVPEGYELDKRGVLWCGPNRGVVTDPN